MIPVLIWGGLGLLTVAVLAGKKSTTAGGKAAPMQGHANIPEGFGRSQVATDAIQAFHHAKKTHNVGADAWLQLPYGLRTAVVAQSIKSGTWASCSNPTYFDFVKVAGGKTMKLAEEVGCAEYDTGSPFIKPGAEIKGEFVNQNVWLRAAREPSGMSQANRAIWDEAQAAVDEMT